MLTNMGPEMTAAPPFLYVYCTCPVRFKFHSARVVVFTRDE
jgi:hypothetical protein